MYERRQHAMYGTFTRDVNLDLGDVVANSAPSYKVHADDVRNSLIKHKKFYQELSFTFSNRKEVEQIAYYLKVRYTTLIHFFEGWE